MTMMWLQRQLGEGLRMMRWPLCVIVLVLGWSAATAFAADDRYVQKLMLPDGGTAVIAEGDLEPRSTGTYTVRVYASDDTAFYSAGVILKRDGTIEDARLADLDGKGAPELVVIIRSAGTGGYLSAQALSVSNKRVEARSHVEGLPKDADPITALTRQSRSDIVIRKGKYHDPNGRAP
jgi:Periplasmic lysozyme inhibitor of I-type lysozyme